MFITGELVTVQTCSLEDSPPPPILAPRGGHRNTVGKRAVRILLECCLATHVVTSHNYCSIFTSIVVFFWACNMFGKYDTCIPLPGFATFWFDIS